MQFCGKLFHEICDLYIFHFFIVLKFYGRRKQKHCYAHFETFSIHVHTMFVSETFVIERFFFCFVWKRNRGILWLSIHFEWHAYESHVFMRSMFLRRPSCRPNCIGTGKLAWDLGIWSKDKISCWQKKNRGKIKTYRWPKESCS